MSDIAEGMPDEEKPAAAVDEKTHKRRASKAQRKAREDRDFFDMMIATEAGRRFLHSILADCHAFEERFAYGPVGFPDPHATWFEAGRQSVGQRLYQAWMLKAPQATMLMLSENDARFQKVDA